MRELAKRGAELVVEDGQLVSSKLGTYHDNITVELAKKYGGQIVTTRDITKVQFGRFREPIERYVRRRVSKAVNMLLAAGIPAYPVYNTNGRHEVVGIKVVTEYSDEDMERMIDYKDGAVARGDLSHAKANLVIQAMEVLRKAQIDHVSRRDTNECQPTK